MFRFPRSLLSIVRSLVYAVVCKTSPFPGANSRLGLRVGVLCDRTSEHSQTRQRISLHIRCVLLVVGFPRKHGPGCAISFRAKRCVWMPSVVKVRTRRPCGRVASQLLGMECRGLAPLRGQADSPAVRVRGEHSQ